jgi:dTDP-4-dehydrorhamnose 3,5-epimerase
MRIVETELPGVMFIELEPVSDERGFFARAYCPAEFAKAGISFTSTQLNLSRNIASFTLRGMHYQPPRFSEAKLVRVVSGSTYDVAVDIRRESPHYGKWVARVLTAKHGEAVFIPEGFAHGFITLEANTDILYQMGRSHEPNQTKGFRFDDPAVGITWPALPAVISPADLAWPPFEA